MTIPDVPPDVLLVGDVESAAIDHLAGCYGLTAERINDGEAITGSFWGEPEAGIKGLSVFVRSDTPIHSMLHEISHIICMCSERRRHLDRNAGSDDLEESAVCYLQIILADFVPGVGRARTKTTGSATDRPVWSFRNHKHTRSATQARTTVFDRVRTCDRLRHSFNIGKSLR